MSKGLLVKFVFLGVAAVIAMLFTGCSFDGTWRGLTEQNYNQAFVVNNERVTRLSGKWSSPGIGWWEYTLSLDPGFVVDKSGSFHYTEALRDGWEYFRFSGKMKKFALGRRKASGEVRTCWVEGTWIYRTPIIYWTAQKDRNKSDITPYGGLYLEPPTQKVREGQPAAPDESAMLLDKSGQVLLIDSSNRDKAIPVSLVEAGNVKGMLAVSRFHAEGSVGDENPLPELTLELLDSFGAPLNGETIREAGDTVLFRVSGQDETTIGDDVSVLLILSLN